VVLGRIVSGPVGECGSVSHGNGGRPRGGLGALWGMGGAIIEVGVSGSKIIYCIVFVVFFFKLTNRT
jgi:hypothetical protein